ncbi:MULTISPECIES: RepB family plasmid replication initiator protein [Lactobacillales]|jgi:plasmid replication initiation protein|nr:MULTISPECIES: RepB family plasmid replication initiator protein [Lactobacillales]QPB61168.1 RepB family plasmid replication initiator protein [Enterococcus faecalis]RXE75219.1 RepB family plasmid replication initiator protein [Enterococcus durans]
MTSIPETNHVKKQVMYMDELTKRKVVEHNDLITSVAKMDKTPLKIFELAVSCIDTDNPPKDHTIYLSKKELFTFFDVSDNDKHSRFKQAIEKMQKQAFFEIREEKNKGYKMKSIVPIPYVEWTDYDDEVTIRFDQAIMPYLIDLKQNFTQYAISDIMELNSKYSIILYKWLSMHYNQYEHYSSKGGRREEQVETYRHPSISIQELRTMTDTVDEYKNMTDFTKWILNAPLKEINQYTHLNVAYDKIKKGRSIDSIVFHITKKWQADDTSYKLDDPLYQEGQAKKEQTEQALYAEAMQSNYTRLLLDAMLLSPYEMTDLALMAGLQKNVYPRYDELKALRGLEGVKTHLSYVREKQAPYSKGNMAKYLKKAIEQYLLTVKRQALS